MDQNLSFLNEGDILSDKVPATLQSRLRVLIAKTYRAEKLYASMLNVGESGAPSNANSPSNSLGKLANDARAREWQASHEYLRSTLNDLTRAGNSAAVLDQLEVLYEQYYARFLESGNALSRGIAALVDTARRQEFAHVLKLSLEMIRHKARAQACKVIADELGALIEESGRGPRQSGERTQPEEDELERIRNVDELKSKDRSDSSKASNSLNRRPLEPSDLGAKIIPLRRRGVGEPQMGQ